MPCFFSRVIKSLMVLAIVGFAISATGCGNAKHGRVKAKNTGCNCGF